MGTRLSRSKFNKHSLHDSICKAIALETSSLGMLPRKNPSSIDTEGQEELPFEFQSDSWEEFNRRLLFQVINA